MHERKIRKDRRCRKCDTTFINIDAEALRLHSEVCNFEQESGIQIIRMKDLENAPDTEFMEE